MYSERNENRCVDRVSLSFYAFIISLHYLFSLDKKTENKKIIIPFKVILGVVCAMVTGGIFVVRGTV